MLTIGIGEIQKNISILSKISEAVEIVDKRKNQKIAVIYPIHKTSVVAKLASKYKNQIKPIEDLDAAKKQAFELAMEEKYASYRR